MDYAKQHLPTRLSRVLNFVLLAMVFTTPTFPILRVDSFFNLFPNQSKQTGFGYGYEYLINEPVSLSTTEQLEARDALAFRLCASLWPNVDANLPAFTYHGSSIAAGIPLQDSTVEYQLAISSKSIPDFGYGLVYLDERINCYGSLDGNIDLARRAYVGGFLEYTRNLVRQYDGQKVSLEFNFLYQIGYLFKIMDTQNELNDEIHKKLPNVNVDFSSLDKRGLFFRFGFSLGTSWLEDFYQSLLIKNTPRKANS